MFSMSLGFRSAMRFTRASWSSDGFEPPDAAVTAFWLDAIATSLTITPSTTYNGSAVALIDVTPRSRTCNPPPGAPEFCWMSAPATFP